jgi:hypothetical protein
VATPFSDKGQKSESLERGEIRTRINDPDDNEDVQSVRQSYSWYLIITHSILSPPPAGSTHWPLINNLHVDISRSNGPIKGLGHHSPSVDRHSSLVSWGVEFVSISRGHDELEQCLVSQ